MESLILAKYAEIALKGKNRGRFEERLADNIAYSSGASREDVRRVRGRIFVSAPEHGARERLRRTASAFGVTEAAHARKVSLDADAIEQAACELAQQRSAAASFKVQTKRLEKRFAYTSQQLNERLGAAIAAHVPHMAVHLDAPDMTVYVEVRPSMALVYTDADVVIGPGGIPTGMSGTCLLMLSGGIDSPVAGWLAMKRGLHLDAVYYHSFPFTGEKTKEKVLDLAQVLSAWQSAPLYVHVPPFADIQKLIRQQAPEDLWTVLFRRSMQRINDRIMRARGYGALITGENLAQVASQTLENMRTIEAAGQSFVLRPLFSYDKQETAQLADYIGTYDIATQPYDDCCTVFTPTRPRTKTFDDHVQQIEEPLALTQLETAAFETMRTYRVTADTIEEHGQ
jgi:thiamine biosynthesis protein ThiI